MAGRVGKGKAPSKAGAISRCKSGPGKAQQAAWKRVLREAAAMPNSKRTKRLRGVCDRAPKYPIGWGAEVVLCCRTPHGPYRYARYCLPAAVDEPITRNRTASELSGP